MGRLCSLPSRRTRSRAIRLAAGSLRWLLPVAGGMLAAAPGLGSCTEWLEVDEEEADTLEPRGHLANVPRRPFRLPTEAARLDGLGPLVPRTPGLRVPEGYWTRARLDVADLWMPYSWMATDPVPGALVVRLLAVGEAAEEDEPLPAPTLRAVLRVSVPDGTTLQALEGLELGAEALEGSTLSLVTRGEHRWLVTPEHLRLEAVRSGVVEGTVSGTARRGAKARRARAFRAGFVALRAK